MHSWLMPVLEINDADESKKVSTIKQKLVDNNLPLTEENLFIVSACAEKGIFFLKGKGHVNVRYKEEKKAAAPAAAPAVVFSACTFSLETEILPALYVLTSVNVTVMLPSLPTVTDETPMPS